MKKILLLIIITGFLFVISSFGATKNLYQKITIRTLHTGASCTLSTDKDSLNIDKTPATITIQRSKAILHIVCRTTGYMGEMAVKANSQMKYPTAISLRLRAVRHDSHSHSTTPHYQHH